MVEARREWLERDYYKDLGVAQDASDEDIAQAYKKLVRKLHPDRNPGNKRAEERFKEVSSAYDVIGNSATRSQYDQTRRMGFYGAGPAGSSGQNKNTFQMGYMEDLFTNLFGGQDRGNDFFRQSVSLRGHDIRTQVRLSFEEAIDGTIKEVSSYDNKRIKVRIPKGVNNGRQIKVPKKGSPGSGDGEPGDLFVKVLVDRHPVFGRSGDNLTLMMPVSFEEAALGTVLKVPTLSDEPVEIRIPAGTSSGTTLRVKQKGVTTNSNKKTSTGDLLVTIEIQVPEKLSSKQKKAIQEMSKEMDPPDRSALNGYSAE